MGYKAVVMFLAVVGADVSADDATVKIQYIPFSAQLYAPESEGTIKDGAFCSCELSKADFQSVLTPDSQKRYTSKNVRLYAVLEGQEYFADVDGYVRSGEEYYVLDVRKFGMLFEPQKTYCAP